MRTAIAVAVVALCVSPAAAQEIPQPGTVVPPSVVKEVKPTYPPGALATGLSGTVTLECLVKADGTVGDARVIQPLDSLLDEEALKAVREWRFKPGTRDGKPVDVAVTIEISFTYRPRGPKLGSAEVYQIGEGVRAPRLVRETKVAYTPEALREHVEGEVTIECVVLPDGTVGDARIVQSLHPQLDREALKTVRQWRFEPGMKDDKTVPVQVSIMMSFTLK